MVIPVHYTLFQVSRDALRTNWNWSRFDCVRFSSVGLIGSKLTPPVNVRLC